jgi:acetoin utilization protein AcuB
MLIRDRMRKNPVTVTRQDTLARAHEKMLTGRFRHLPVVYDSHVIGILTDRDLGHHMGAEKQTRVGTAMTENPLTVSPLSTVEEIARLLLQHQISGLPVVEEERLVGIITTSDVLQAFLGLTGAGVEGSVRIDVRHENDNAKMDEALLLMREHTIEVLGVGVYRDPAREHAIFYLRLRGDDAEAAAMALRDRGYIVLGMHP